MLKLNKKKRFNTFQYTINFNLDNRLVYLSTYCLFFVNPSCCKTNNCRFNNCSIFQGINV